MPVLLSAAFLGGIPTGWSAYAPLANQAPPGMDAFLLTIIGFSVSVALSGMNITTTAMTMRARGLTLVRLPIFVWGTVASVALGLVAFPMFMSSQMLEGLDRTLGTTFYVAQSGGSVWLYQNLFWLMGHPEVYVILLPGFAAVLELTPVFCRKPLYSYTGAIIGMAGIVGLSLFVWAHHMYVSGFAPDLNGPFMLTTEMISVPTGLLILVLVGTIWRGRVWTRLPMMALYAMIWNFIIGGVTGIYLSDVPVDQAMHGSLFVVAHFRYTLMGGALVGAIAALSYWFGMLIYLGALITSWVSGEPAPPDPWGGKTLEWHVPTPVLLLLRVTRPAARRRWIVPVLRSRAAHALTSPVLTWVLFAGVLMGTHFSPFYDYALRHPAVHLLVEHPLYLTAALFYYYPLLDGNPCPRYVDPGIRVLSLGLMMVPETLTGFFIYASNYVLYPFYAAVPRPFGPGPLADQQIGGILMWAGGMIIDTGWLALACAAWLRHDRARTRRMDAQLARTLGLSR